MDALEDAGDEYAGRQAAPTVNRAFRALTRAGNAAGDVALGDDQTTRARAHLDRGRPDPRRNDQVPSGHPSAPETPFQSQGEERHNARHDVAINPESAPTRPRQGFTGADPTRAARFQFVTLLRRFDQAIGRQHPGPITKVAMDSPLAARPPERKRLAGARPSATGSTGTGMTPAGPQRNTFRLVPGAWDERLVNDGSRATDAAASRRDRGWRL